MVNTRLSAELAVLLNDPNKATSFTEVNQAALDAATGVMATKWVADASRVDPVPTTDYQACIDKINIWNAVAGNPTSVTTTTDLNN